ncbi:MAG: restriction endonuclease subunit S, partial [Bacteroides sp.]|nr:restriction endonuclease subunit S [Bacteroides sp.]
MDTKKLRQKILDLAIRGKLVPQDPTDEPASVLLQRIRAEKERLIAEGKIKRPKKSKTPSSESNYQQFEPPFEIPASWQWVTLDDLAFYKKGPFGSSLTKSMFVPKDKNTYKVYEQKNAIQKDATLGNYYITFEKFEELRGFEVFEKDIIVSCAGTIGETFVLPPNIENGIINQALMIVRLYLPEIKRYYLDYFDSVLKQTAAKDGKGTAIKNIPPFEVLKAYPFPLPPLKEQFRIANAIDTYFGLLEKVEQSKTKIIKYVSSVKSKILELAMQGKLVPQDPTDEPAAEMLKRINPNAKILTDFQ